MAEDTIPGLEGQAGDATRQLRRLLRAAKEDRFRILLLGAVGMILGGFVATLLPTLYESKTLLLLRERELIDDSRLLRSIQDKPLVQKEQTLEQELKSFSWIVDVLEEVEWPEYAAIRNDPAQVRKLVEKVRDPEHFSVDVQTNPAGELLVEISFRWYDPKKAHDFVRAARRNWIRHRDEDTRNYWRAKLLQAEEIVRERRRAFEEALGARERFLTEHGMELLSDESTDARVKTALVEKRADLASQLTELETRLEGLQERLQREEPFRVVENQERNPDYEAAKNRLQAVQAALAALLQKGLKESHPRVREAREAVEEALAAWERVKDRPFLATERRQVPNPTYEELKKQIELETPKLRSLQDQLAAIDRQIEEIDRRLERLPTLKTTLDRLDNEYQVAQTALNAALDEISPLRDRVQQMENRSASLFADSEEELAESGAFEILEDPVIPDTPVGLPKVVVPFIGMLVGIGLGLALAFLREVTRSTFDEPEEVQETLRLPVLGYAGRIATEEELRRERWAEIVRMAGSLLLVAALGAAVYVVTARPEVLPLRFQDALEDLRANFQ